MFAHIRPVPFPTRRVALFFRHTWYMCPVAFVATPSLLQHLTFATPYLCNTLPFATHSLVQYLTFATTSICNTLQLLPFATHSLEQYLAIAAPPILHYLPFTRPLCDIYPLQHLPFATPSVFITNVPSYNTFASHSAGAVMKATWTGTALACAICSVRAATTPAEACTRWTPTRSRTPPPLPTRTTGLTRTATMTTSKTAS